MSTDMLSEGELDDRLYKANPVSRAALDNESVNAALASALRDVESSGYGATAPRRSRRPVYRRRWATFSAAMATAGVASLVGVETLLGGAGGAGLPLAVTPAAAAQLGTFAHAAAGQEAPGAGQFEYTAVETETSADPSFGAASVNFTYDETVQSWNGPIPIDESRQRTTSNGITFASPQDRANYLANKSAVDTRYSDISGTNDLTTTGEILDGVYPARGVKQEGNLTPIQREIFEGSERPSSPQELLHDLTASFDGQPSDLWGGLFTILRDATNAQLRAMAYRAFAYVPGTTMLGNRTDQLGRIGAAIQFTDRADGWTQIMIVSPSTGYLLQDTSSFSASSKGGAMTQRDVYLERGVVNSVTALPNGGSQPFTAATETEDLSNGTETPTLQTKTSTSQATTSTPQASTTGAQTTTSTAPDATTTSTKPVTTSTAQTSTDSQTTTSTPQN